MATPAAQLPYDNDLETAFYRHVLQLLDAAQVPVMVGGAYAMSAYTGIARRTKDLDLFLRRADYDRAAQVLAAAGYPTELKFPHWLGKARADPWFVDLIFDSGNGLTPVDDVWLEHAVEAEVLGLPVRIVPVEEMIWSKAFLMERERYDGADVVHLLRARGATMDWSRLYERMTPHWRVLLSHLVLFGFIYPAERNLVPRWIMVALHKRLQQEVDAPPPRGAVCQGTLLSREQYLHDLREGLGDARRSPPGR